MSIYHTSTENATPISKPIEEMLGTERKQEEHHSQPICITARNTFLYMMGADGNPYTEEPSRTYPEPSAVEMKEYLERNRQFMRTGGWPEFE